MSSNWDIICIHSTASTSATGSIDGILRFWNPYVPAKPVTVRMSPEFTCISVGYN